MRLSEPKRPGQDAAKNAEQFYKWMYQATESLNMVFEQLERNNVLDLQAQGYGTTAESGLLLAEVEDLEKAAQDLQRAQTAQTQQISQIGTDVENQGQQITQIKAQIGDYTILTGVASIEFGAQTFTTTVTFSKKFKEKPMVMLTQVFDDANLVVKDETVTTSNFVVGVPGVFSTGGTRTFSWLAIGKV